MVIFTWICALLAILALCMALRLWWAWRQLKNHPHVEPLHIAAPHIAPELNQMINNIASIAGITAPETYIWRGRFGNAFVAATIMRHELFLSDELFESCDQCDDALEQLTKVICHEIAHIQRDDAIRLGTLTYIANICSEIGLNKVSSRCQMAIKHIENETDIQGNILMQQL